LSNDLVIKSDATGMIRTGVAPHSNKKREGATTVKIMDSKCSPEVNFDWGRI
jgi:hypothetical protein